MSATAERSPQTVETASTPKIETPKQPTEGQQAAEDLSKEVTSIQESNANFKDVQSIIENISEQQVPPPSMENHTPDIYHDTQKASSPFQNSPQEALILPFDSKGVPIDQNNPEDKTIHGDEAIRSDPYKQYETIPLEQSQASEQKIEDKPQTQEQNVKENTENTPENPQQIKEYTPLEQAKDRADARQKYFDEFLTKNPEPENKDSNEHRTWEMKKDLFVSRDLESLADAEVEQKKLENERQQENPQQKEKQPTEKEKKEQEEKERRKKELREQANRLLKEIQQGLTNRENLTPEQKQDLLSKSDELKNVLAELDKISDKKDLILLTLLKTAFDIIINIVKEWGETFKNK